MMSQDDSSFIVSVKMKIKETGLQVQGSFWDFLNNATSLLPHIVGNDLVIATVVPMIPSLIVDAVKRELFQEHMPDIANRLNERKDKLNYEFIRSHKGKKLFQDTIEEILKQAEKQKIEFHKNLLINSFTTRDINEERIFAYMKILISLEPPALQILGALWKPDETTDKIMKNIKVSDDGVIAFTIKDDLRRLLKIDNELYERSVKRLESENMLTTQGQTTQWATGSYAKEYRKEGIESVKAGLKRLMTDFGNDFLKYVMLQSQ